MADFEGPSAFSRFSYSRWTFTFMPLLGRSRRKKIGHSTAAYEPSLYWKLDFIPSSSLVLSPLLLRSGTVIQFLPSPIPFSSSSSCFIPFQLWLVTERNRMTTRKRVCECERESESREVNVRCNLIDCSYEISTVQQYLNFWQLVPAC